VGVRVLAQKIKKLNENVMVTSTAGDLKAVARVVYCEQMQDGCYAVGLELPGMTCHWMDTPAAGTII
jgi:hypothetical protein